MPKTLFSELQTVEVSFQVYQIFCRFKLIRLHVTGDKMKVYEQTMRNGKRKRFKSVTKFDQVIPNELMCTYVFLLINL